jgi:hypothetical protein
VQIALQGDLVVLRQLLLALRLDLQILVIAGVELAARILIGAHPAMSRDAAPVPQVS